MFYQTLIQAPLFFLKIKLNSLEMPQFDAIYYFGYYLHSTTVHKIKMPLTPREMENPTIQMEEHSNSFFCDRVSAKILKNN